MMFKVGDKVTWCGVQGVVIYDALRIDVEFDDGNCWSFTSDGRSHLWHKEPSLRKVEEKCFGDTHKLCPYYTCRTCHVGNSCDGCQGQLIDKLKDDKPAKIEKLGTFNCLPGLKAKYVKPHFDKEEIYNKIQELVERFNKAGI